LLPKIVNKKIGFEELFPFQTIPDFTVTTYLE
jgi:hypothetical protein